MEQYEKLEFEIIKFDNVDVIICSDGATNAWNIVPNITGSSDGGTNAWNIPPVAGSGN